MKNLTILTCLFVFISLFVACDDGANSPVANSNPDNPSITAPQPNESYMLELDQADDTLLTMAWSKPDYGFAAAPTYTVQMSLSSNNFADPISLVTLNKTSYSITVGDMNGKLLGQNLSPNVQASIQFRVMSSLSDSLKKQISEPINLNFTPYSTCKYCPEIYAPGSYQMASGYGSNWTPADAHALHTIGDTDVYDGYLYMANEGNEFKFTPERNFNSDFGIQNNQGVLVAKGNNIPQPKSGFFKVHVDINTLTYTMTKTKWAIIGAAANGWNDGDDVNMTYNKNKQVWQKKLDLKQGPIKFRANSSFDINFGDDNGDGILESGGGNISVPAKGNYTVTFDLNSYPYTYTLKKN